MHTALKLTISSKVDMKSKYRTNRVCRSSSQALPNCIIIDIPSNKECRNEFLETTKAAILRVNIDYLDILAFYIFD